METGGFFLVVLLAVTCLVEFGYSAGVFLENAGHHKHLVTPYSSLEPPIVKDLFEDFANKFDKKYTSSEEKETRLKIFTDNLKMYDEMNRLDKGTATYGIGKFSDMTAEEFKKKMLTLNAAAIHKKTRKTFDGANLANVRIPNDFDWREKGAVGPVKSQGDCGSCWAFSTVGNLEGVNFVKHQKLQILSEQQLVDCDPYDKGCGGGNMLDAVQYIIEAGGIMSSEAYPYVAHNQTCAFKKSQVVVKAKDIVLLPERDEVIMAQYLFENGPISVGLDARFLHAYTGGIAHPPEEICGRDVTVLNHGLTLVGFGVKLEMARNRDTKIPFWIIKNSWGPDHGEQGYLYLYRGGGLCGIDDIPSSAIIE